jgi:hypothetical protein
MKFEGRLRVSIARCAEDRGRGREREGSSASAAVTHMEEGFVCQLMPHVSRDCWVQAYVKSTVSKRACAPSTFGVPRWHSLCAAVGAVFHIDVGRYRP